MNQSNRQTKIDAIRTLIKFSLLFTLEDKNNIGKKLTDLTEEELETIGKVLSVEHQNREILDKILEDPAP